MARITLGAVLALLAFPFLLPAADDPVPSRDILVLQEAIQNTIKTAEPCVVCVLVSRSDQYEKRFRQTIPPDNPGHLGGFSMEAEMRGFKLTTAEADAIRKLDLSLPSTVPESFGSGIVVDEALRLVLTNYHVVRDATKVYVRLPNDTGSYANIHAADPRSDLAVLQLIDPKVRLKAIRMSDGKPVRKGQFVVALANPYAAGYRDGSPSASWGIVSNIRRRAAGPTEELRRPEMTLAQFDSLIQTDVRLDLGCSGGALVNLKGELVGLTNSLAALTGVESAGGFALPMDASIQKIVEVLKRGEEVEYGFLGVSTDQTVLRRGEGFPIVSALPNSPGERALNVRPNALQGRPVYVLSVNGQPIREWDDLFFFIGTALAGSTAMLEVRLPDGKIESKPTTLVKAYVPGKIIVSKRSPEFGGLRIDYSSVYFQRLTPGSRLGIPRGVVIREVLTGSPAAAAGLEPDKLITQVNNHLVDTPAEFYREMRNATGTVDLTINGLNGNVEHVKLEIR